MSLKPNLSILSITLGSGGAEKVISLLLKELIKDYNVTLVLFYNQIHFPIPKEVKVVSFSNNVTKKPFYLKAFDAITFVFKYNHILKKRKINYAVSFLAFPNLVNVKPPDFEGRSEILDIYTEKMPLDDDVNLEQLSRDLDGFVGSDIEALCREAGLLALRENIDADRVSQHHFVEARQRVHATMTPQAQEYYEHDRLGNEFLGLVCGLAQSGFCP